MAVPFRHLCSRSRTAGAALRASLPVKFAGRSISSASAGSPCSSRGFAASLHSSWTQSRGEAGQSASCSSEAPALEVVRSHAEGLLVLGARSSFATGSKSTARGHVFEHAGREWVCVFEVDRYWWAAPLKMEEACWLQVEDRSNHGESCAAECLARPTPTQAERAQLSKGLNTGVIAVDTLAPVGVGQSMLICGPQGTGKSTLAKQVLEQALTLRQVDKAFRFLSDPCAPPADPAQQRAGALVEMAISPSTKQGSASFLAPLFATVGAAEAVRDAGQNALLVLDTAEPVLKAWDLAVQMAEACGNPMNSDSLAAQRRAFFAALFERAAVLPSGGSLTMLVLLDTEAMAALAAAAAGASVADSNHAFQVSDFEGRRPPEMERLRRLEARGVALTAQALMAVGIAPPKSSSEAPDNTAVGGKASREMQSLSDGQIILDKTAAAEGRFPAIVPGASFSRFGLGGSGSKEGAPARQARDVRPPTLQAVSAHLRMLLALEQEAHFRPKTDSVDGIQSAQLQAVMAALLQPPGAPLLAEEMTVLLLAAVSGALDPMPSSRVAAVLSGGSRSPLLCHLQEAIPSVLKKIAEEPQLSKVTIRELEVAVRLFVKLKEAEASPDATTAAE
ncbi:unnamed protein product [Polarella glacialis]|uniref:ATPase F1/V1/A1 complex alpha/beta subunit nucleotide-binding domain-containing protein n=1 Tax=Polarella glacialis TaxID=89957 RepID=A0A813LBK8_POLGL|nr:unnamed protein product [Polarella glacialis]